MTTSPPADATPELSVRGAQQADLLSVFRIENASFGQPWPFAALEAHLDAVAFLVAEGPEMTDGSPLDAASILGYVVADTVPNGVRPFGHVKDLAVHPDHRGRGVGALLLERAIDRLAARGAVSVKLEVRRSNDVARSLYESRGFRYRRTVDRYYDDGEDALVYVREL